MKFSKFSIVLFLSGSFLYSQSIEYPESKKVNQVDDYFGVKVEDPYRWLEDDTSEDTEKWVEVQNKVTFNYLENIPFREKLRKRLTAIWDYEKYSQPFKKGENYYFYKNDGLQELSVVYKQKDLESDAEVFLDPHTFSKDNTIRLSGLYFSQDDKYCGYATTTGGSDWNEFYVMDAYTKEKLSDHLKWIKFSSMAWYKDGFYYSRYDEPSEESKLKARNENQKLYYHKLGTEQSMDQLILKASSNPNYAFSPFVTEDEKFLIITVWMGTSKNMIYYKNLEKDSKITKLIDSFYSDFIFIDNINGGFLVQTNHNAPNFKLIWIDPNNSSEQNWKTIIPEHEFVMSKVHHLGGKLIVQYLKDAITGVAKLWQKVKNSEAIILDPLDDQDFGHEVRFRIFAIKDPDENILRIGEQIE